MGVLLDVEIRCDVDLMLWFCRQKKCSDCIYQLVWCFEDIIDGWFIERNMSLKEGNLYVYLGVGHVKRI